MAKQTHSSSVDLETTTLADLAELFGEKIAAALDTAVRQIVREELDRERQAAS
jgi:hypothetical protein